MEKKLEDKIIDSVYRFETKKTGLQIISNIVIMLCVGFVVFIFASLTIDYFSQLHTVDVLEIFTDGMDTVMNNVGNIMNIIYYETPKRLVTLLLISSLLLFYILLTFVTNFESMSKKIQSIIRFWLKR